MAPEQFNGSYLDEKVDVYALGCILNECLTRRRPWETAPNFFQVKSVMLQITLTNAYEGELAGRNLSRCAGHNENLTRQCCTSLAEVRMVLFSS